METKGAIVTVVGTDQVGIIAKVSAYLAAHDINIEDISQTILSGRFVMMMSVDLHKTATNLEALKNELAEMGRKERLSISVIHEDVFSAMHRI